MRGSLVASLGTALFCAAFFVAYTIQGITGFAGNMFAMPAGIHTLGMEQSVAVLNAMGAMACGLLAVLNWRHIDWRQLGRIVAVMSPFMLVGIWIDGVASLRALLLGYGVLIVGVGAYNLAVKRQRILPAWAQWGLLVGAGLVQGMFVSGGALLVVYAVQKIQDKLAFRATLSMVWAVLNLAYALIAWGQGSFTVEVQGVVLMCVPLAAMATVGGNWIGSRISKAAFLKMAYVVLVGIGVALVGSAWA
ncbi:sulfite exporter TauE/SafE family protein [Eggerthellaceae bacterium zg-1084]|uniref:sulfite exporter TauE/SafE family protein n=1 Tax=Berryella wangjianweii TaxID=2734634 RepID=UPI001552CED9|nr:sulfite exporter TauE/SafE family protein [Berryella wangjianweii]NPD31545.1 sulfite exporter TauE/SafE family protein [Berryella wangjianweii]NPD32960.1 sulfite exporter TauE/SafE family protein [Eggerthellaceae bacterium zg-997]